MIDHYDRNDRYCESTRLVLYKIDKDTKDGLSGAVFDLLKDGQVVDSGATNAKGQLKFCVTACQTYLIREFAPPLGYKSDDTAYYICVDGCGHLYVNGEPTDRLVVENTKVVEGSFTAIKVNAADDTPLVGAKYTLFAGSIPIASTVSTAAGEVRFAALEPGAYELVEIEPPTDFQDNPERIPVIVAADGSVTINGKAADGCRLTNTPLGHISEVPVIFPIASDDKQVTGKGVAGAQVTVTFPGGSTKTVTVGPDGTWSVDVPAGISLNPGDTVSAVQKEPDKDESAAVTAKVDEIPNGYCYKYYRNLSRYLNVYAGDILEFILTVGNDTSTTSVWPNIAVTDRIHEFTTLMAGSIRIDGVRSTIGPNIDQYNYDADTRILTVYLGDMQPGDESVVSYRVRINDDWAGASFNNSIDAGPLASGVPLGLKGPHVSASVTIKNMND